MASINDLATAAVSALSPGATDVATTTSAAEGAERHRNSSSAAASSAHEPFSISSSALPAPAHASTSDAARGALVILEGLDRSGKTTQVKLLEQRFVELGKRVKVMRFPGRLFFFSLSLCLFTVFVM